MGKLLCNHVRNPGWIACQGKTIRAPNFQISKLQIWSSQSFNLSRLENDYRVIPELTTIESFTMRVAPIDHHWWYDCQVITYDPRLVGRTNLALVDRKLWFRGAELFYMITWDRLLRMSPLPQRLFFGNYCRGAHKPRFLQKS